MDKKLPVVPFTAEGYQKLQDDLKRLSEYRKEVLVRLQNAREMGDLSENGAYKAARFELSDTDRELRRINYLLRVGKVQTKVGQSQGVGFGSQVTLKNANHELTFTLVNNYESNPSQQKLSVTSPYGQAVMGKKVGDQVIVHAPAGDLNFTLTKLQ